MRIWKASLILTVFISLTMVPWAHSDGKVNVQKNKEMARQFFEEVLGKGRFEIADSLHAPDFVVHTVGDSVATHEQNMKWSRGWRQAFPDLTIKVKEIVGEGDYVAVYWSGHGTNTGTGNGLPATGRTVQGDAFTLYRFSNGKIAEEWSKWGELEMMQQLGLVECKPAPAEGR